MDISGVISDRTHLSPDVRCLANQGRRKAPCEESREIWHDTGEENKQGKWGIKKESRVRLDGLPFSRLWWFTRFYKGPSILAIKWSSYPDCLHKSGQGSWHFTLGENLIQQLTQVQTTLLARGKKSKRKKRRKKKPLRWPSLSTSRWLER